MGAILVGTASWTDKMLVESGLFYPKEAKSPEDRLRYYAGRFRVVEVDSSYYAMPSARNAALWVDRTREGFVFDIKAFRLFTGHQTPPKALPADVLRALGPIEKKNLYYRDIPAQVMAEMWERYRGAVAPLRAAGRLGVVLLQFPPWFTFTKGSLEHIRACRRELEGHRVAVEFRHRSWLEGARRDEVLALERDLGLVHVVVDEPQGFASSVPAVWEVTSSDVAVVRLHGRNSETWEKKGLETSAERFNYLYSDEELGTLVGPLEQLSERTEAVHVLFNNNYLSYAQDNASSLLEMLAEASGRPG